MDFKSVVGTNVKHIKLKKWNTRDEAFEKIKFSFEDRTSRSEITNKIGELTTNECPHCNKTIAGSVTELKSHFSICVASSEEVNDEFIEVDDDDFEEYEWAGQKRIRSTSLFMGGLKAAGFQTITKTNKDEVLDVINVHVSG